MAGIAHVHAILKPQVIFTVYFHEVVTGNAVDFTIDKFHPSALGFFD
jgi:hypothetical protein